MKTIFTITMTPVSLPLDDGPKNIVLGIAQRIKDYRFCFISSSSGKIGAEDNIAFIDSPFQKSGRHKMALMQKLFIFFVILLGLRKFDIFQFFFTPRPYFSRVFKVLMRVSGKKSVQVLSSVHTLFDKNKESQVPPLFFADYTVVMSEHAKARLSQAGVQNLVRIYPGVEMGRFDAGKLGKDFFGASSKEINIIYSGTYKVLRDSYSFEAFCDIVSRVTSRCADARFVMACRIRTKEEAIMERDFKKISDERGLSGNFRFLNTIEDMPLLFNSCFAGFMPAKVNMSGVLEIPLAILEMAALEKVVLYPDCKPLDELSGKGIGIMIDDPAPLAYADTLIKLIEDRGFAAKTGKVSREAVVKHFNMDNAAEQYRKVYNSLG